MEKIPEYPKNLKKTMPRMEIFDVLRQSDYPLSAAEIYEKISNEGFKINFSTIYRTLNAFADAGIVIEHKLPGSDEGLYELKREHHQHYAICLNCRKKIPLSSCPLAKNITELENNEFQVTEHHVELYGYCKECMEKIKKDDKDV